MPPPKAPARKKEVKAKVKLQIPGGQATPAPPVGPALGQHGVNIGEFVQKFNERSKDTRGLILPVELTIYADRTFDFIIKSPPAAVLVRRAVGLAKGAQKPGSETVGSITRAQLEEIAKTKVKDLNAVDLEGAVRQIMGTCRSMGVNVTG
jgi:large subunit ribosomal protein L11